MIWDFKLLFATVGPNGLGRPFSIGHGLPDHDPNSQSLHIHNFDFPRLADLGPASNREAERHQAVSSSPRLRSQIVIPARLASTRLPEKLLLRETGKTVLQHTYEAALVAERPASIIVAVDSQRLQAEVQAFGGQSILTDPELPSGTDRVAVVARQFPDMDAFINVQGDEPEISGSAIDLVAELLEQHLMPTWPRWRRRFVSVRGWTIQAASRLFAIIVDTRCTLAGRPFRTRGHGTTSIFAAIPRHFCSTWGSTVIDATF